MHACMHVLVCVCMHACMNACSIFYMCVYIDTYAYRYRCILYSPTSNTDLTHPCMTPGQKDRESAPPPTKRQLSLGGAGDVSSKEIPPPHIHTHTTANSEKETPASAKETPNETPRETKETSSAQASDTIRALRNENWHLSCEVDLLRRAVER